MTNNYYCFIMPFLFFVFVVLQAEAVDRRGHREERLPEEAGPHADSGHRGLHGAQGGQGPRPHHQGGRGRRRGLRHRRSVDGWVGLGQVRSS